MAKYTGRGLVVKRPGVLSKVQMLNLILGVRVFSLLPNFWGGAKLPEKASRDIRYRSDSIAISRDMGTKLHLASTLHHKTVSWRLLSIQWWCLSTSEEFAAEFRTSALAV